MKHGFRKLANALILFAFAVLFIGGYWGGLSENQPLKDFLEVFILCYLVIAFIRQIGLFVGTLIFKLKIKAIKRKSINYHPFVTILVPAYNEEKVIADTVKNLLQQNYDNYEILVIDDGSTDTTSAQVWNLIAQNPHRDCRIILQANKGKAAALNYGISESEGEIIMCVDADSKLNLNAIQNGVRHFVDAKVGAVSGFVRVGRTSSTLLKFQDLEYSITLNFTRPALALTGSVTIVPGPAGMFRKEVLASIHGYNEDRDIFAEDADLTIRLLAHGYKVTSESQMISYTEAPQNLKALLRQRYRWNRGILQAILANIKPLTTTAGWRGKYIVSYLLLDALVVRSINFALCLYFIGNFYSTGEVYLFTKWFAALMVMDCTIVTFTASSLRAYLGNLIVLILSRVSYDFVLLTWGVCSTVDECLESRMTWDKLERTGQLIAERST